MQGEDIISCVFDRYGERNHQGGRGEGASHLAPVDFTVFLVIGGADVSVEKSCVLEVSYMVPYNLC